MILFFCSSLIFCAPFTLFSRHGAYMEANMEEKFMRDFLFNAPFGFAYHKLICNPEGITEDFIFLKVNKAFEQITGLKAEDIIGKKASEVLSGTSKGGFALVDFYGKIDLCCGENEIELYSPSLGRWFKVAVFVPEKGYFAAVYNEITTEINYIKLLEERRRKITDLNTELETVFNSTHDAMFLVKFENGEFRYIRINKSHQKLSGFDAQFIIGKTPIEAAGEKTGSILINGYTKCVEAKSSITYEETLPFPSGEKIPLICRILAVADAFDAMTNDRVYRKAMGKDEAVKELKRQSGKQFDPKVCDVFLACLNNKNNQPTVSIDKGI